MELKYKVLKKEIPYTGRELSSHWIYNNFNLQGNAIVAFMGPAEVREHLVDMADRKRRQYIRSSLMLHFIYEYFDLDLEKTILREMLLIGLISQEINKISKRYVVEQRGNDLYVKGRKLSVAIATLTPVSCMFHIGLNIADSCAPVKVIGLNELSISPRPFAEKILRLYNLTLEAVKVARAKVRGVQ